MPTARIFFKCLFVTLGLCLGYLTVLAQVPQKKTAAEVADSVRQKQVADSIRWRLNEEKILESIKQYTKRKSLPAKIVSALFDFGKAEEQTLGRDAELLNQQYAQHTYKVVRYIDFKVLNVFGYSVQDTARRPDNFFKKAGNALHVKTGRGQIRNKLLFKKGEKLEPFALSESERLLRQAGYIYDARILVNEATTTNDSVDIIVITRDIFSLGGSASYTPSSGAGRISVRDVNFLGQGHQFRHTYRFGQSYPQPWDYRGSYRIENISNTYLSANLEYENRYQFEKKAFNIGRDFFATTTKYAGAVGVTWLNITTPIQHNDTLLNYYDIKLRTQDVWFGRSFKLRSYDLGYEHPGRIITGARVINTSFTQGPDSVFSGDVLLMGTLGYSLRKYYKDNYLFGFGRTEDIPAGNLFSVTAGHQLFENGNTRPYFAAQTAFGKYRQSFGYLYMNIGYGSFVNNGNWQQGLLKSEALYFTRLYKLGNWRWRQFIWNRLTYGVNRAPGDVLRINKEEGLRGFRSGTLTGDRRFVINYESNLFTPISFLGFRVAGVVFADIAWLAEPGKKMFADAPYQGYGIGFRLRNEYMTFSTVQFLLGYYPRLPHNEDLNNLKIFNASRPFYNFSDLNLSRPGVVEFR
ncbi:MAG: hypothetical protein LPK19_00115 [Hymenobacteraceae bacterium]|nr:hypothetical protein [Hymenobacteraceae bacterium]MDX5394576.1 hypothetical protein [Hymenobacteraceae bacterium]MDX5510597.1 hypothetical protein [Hymenobacteraceae bacterium]